MKGLGTLVVLGIGVLAALYLGVDTMLLGRDIDPSQVPLPDANEAGRTAQEGADRAAGEVNSWSPLVWRWIVIGVATSVAMIMWNSSAKFKYGVIGAGLAAIAFVVFIR